jgi:hypothetical protein
MQDILAILIAALAAMFLAHRAWQRLVIRRDGGCGSCAHCPSFNVRKSPPLVAISPISRSAKTPIRGEIGN